jgi:hypothetical protein
MHEMPRVARSAQEPAAQIALLSVKRSLVGHAGQCPFISLFNGFSDIKIGGRNNGQKGW